MIELRSSTFKDTFYHKSGAGSTIILLHGFGEDSTIWEFQRDFLVQQCQVIVPDFPGTGSSSMPEGGMSIESLADFLFEIIEQEGLNKVTLVGHSMGGYVGLSFLAKYPNKLRGLSLVHSSSFADDDLKIENRKKSIKLIENDGKEVFLKAMIPNLYSEQSRKTVADSIQLHLTNALKIPSSTLIAYYNAMILRTDTSKVLENAEMPIQFIIGKEDNAVPLEASLKMCHLPKTADIQILDKIGHTSMNECPELLNSMLDKYINILHG